MKLAPEVKEQIENCLYGEVPKGKTLRQLFERCERAGAVVYWGLWSEQQLDSVVE